MTSLKSKQLGEIKSVSGFRPVASTRLVKDVVQLCAFCVGTVIFWATLLLSYSAIIGS